MFQNENRREVKAWMSANLTNQVASLGNIHTYSDRIVKFPVLLGEPEVQPLTGVTVTIDAVGSVAYKGSLTRTAVSLGTWQKKKDTRELWVTVEGPDFVWIVKYPPQLSGAARKFAAKVLNASKQAYKES